MLWFTNRLLHIFGWAIVVSVDDAGSIIDAYPARVRFRGFSEKIEANGFEKVSAFLNQESQNLLDESRDDRTDC